jgi:hypothetical protein
MNGMAHARYSVRPVYPVRFYVPLFEPCGENYMLNLRNLFGKKTEDEKNVATIQAPPGAQSPGIAGAVAKLFDKNEKEVAKLRPMVDRINQLGPALKAMSDEELKAKSASCASAFAMK